jgi:hypothetical protein
MPSSFIIFILPQPLNSFGFIKRAIEDSLRLFLFASGRGCGAILKTLEAYQRFLVPMS